VTEKVLFSWIGEIDLRAAISDAPLDAPISSTLSDFSFDCVILLYSYPKVRSTPYPPPSVTLVVRLINFNRTDNTEFNNGFLQRRFQRANVSALKSAPLQNGYLA